MLININHVVEGLKTCAAVKRGQITCNSCPYKDSKEQCEVRLLSEAALAVTVTQAGLFDDF